MFGGPMGGPGGPPPGGPGMKNPYENSKVKPPKNVKDVSRYLKELLGGFFSRLFYIFGLVWETDHKILFIMLFIAIFNGVMPVIGSLISKEILNEFQVILVSQGKELDFWHSNILFLLIFLFVHRILNNAVGKVNNAVSRIAGEKVVNCVKLKIMNKAKELDIESFDNPDFYERLENANREAGNRPLSILESTFSILSTVIGLVSYIVILSAALPLATVCIILVSAPSAIVNFRYRRKNFEYMRRRSKPRRQMNYYTNLLVNKDMVKEIRMFKLSDIFIGKYKEAFANYFGGLKRIIIEEGILNVSISIISSIVNCALFIVIAKGVFDGRYMIGDYTLYTGTLTSIANNVTSLIKTSASIYEGTLFIDNLIVFMKEKRHVVPVIPEPYKVNRGGAHTIEFQNVSFRYPGTERDVIKNMSFKINPSETVVLVGLNGAGKTTLIKLLTRLYDPTAGRILLDGRDIREYDTEDLYSMFGIIFQDYGRYAESVSDNIHFGDIDKEFDINKIKKAAEQSNASEYIDRLPLGYDTPLMRIFEKEGLELSVGQWQKLAVARAFYGESDILILDEPTASLDAIAEQEIFSQFDKLRKDKTTIFVSHRLSSATVASKILVVEQGVLVEEGNHKELMILQGKYFELFSTQAKRYKEEESDFGD